MHFSAIDETSVVESSGGIEDILVHVIVNGHIHGLLNHLADMVLPMGFVKRGVTRNNLVFNIPH